MFVLSFAIAPFFVEKSFISKLKGFVSMVKSWDLVKSVNTKRVSFSKNWFKVNGKDKLSLSLIITLSFLEFSARCFKIWEKLNSLSKKFIPGELEYGVRKDGSMKVKVLNPQKTQKSRIESYKKVVGESFDINTPEGRLNMKKLNTSVAFQKFLKENGIVVPGCGRIANKEGGRITFSNGTCGGFKNAVNNPNAENSRFGASNDLALSFNVVSDLPVKLPKVVPHRLFFDTGFAKGAENEFIYSGGLLLDYKILQLHLPLFQSKVITDLYDRTGTKLFSRISFVLSLEKYHPHHFIEEMKY